MYFTVYFIGYCCIQYNACEGDDAFSLGPEGDMAMFDSMCSLDYVVIEGKQKN